MDVKTQKMYSEVYAVLNALGDEYIRKLPANLYELIEKSRLDTYAPVYNIETLENEKNISRDSVAMIALFHLNYWCENEEEKQALENLLEENEKKNHEMLKESYRLENVLAKQKEEASPFATKEESQPISDKEKSDTSLAKKESFLTRILKKLFHRT